MARACCARRLPDSEDWSQGEDAWDMSDRLAGEEALYVGRSSGANVFAAVEVAKKLHAAGEGGCVVAIVCERGDRYFAPMK